MATARCSRALRVLLVAPALLVAGLAHAQCKPAATASQLTISGFATAYFEQFRTDTAHGSIELYGGVCLVGVTPAWTLAADRVSVTGLTGELSVSATATVLTVAGWTVDATGLDATRRRLGLSGVHLTGHGVAGDARAASLDLTDGQLRLSALTLHGAAFYLRGEEAVLAGDSLSVTGPVVTTCNCPGPPLYDVAGVSAHVDVQAQRIVLTGGRVKVAGLDVPLANTVTIDAETLKALALPIKVEYVAGDAATGTPGTGLGVILTRLGLAPDVAAQVGVTGLDGDHPLAGVALLNGSADGTSFTFGLARGGLRLVETTDHAVTPWFDVGYDTRILEPGNRDTLRDSVLHARLHGDLPRLNGNAALSLFAAASAQRPAGGPVAGARLGAEASASAATAEGAAWGRLSLGLDATFSDYPDQQATQWGVEIAPAYALRTGPLHLELAYLARLTDSGSPFATSLDRLEPVERPSGSVSIRGRLAPGWRATARIAARYDLVGNSSVAAGLNVLDAGASLTRSLDGWDLSVSGSAALAGVLAPDGKRDGYLQGSVDAARGDLSVGATVRYRYAPAPARLDLLQLSAAVPIDMPGVMLRPYLALDFAPTVDAGLLPAISGHGLELTVPTCCGALKVGYRDQEGTWTVSVAVDLQAGAGTTTAHCPARPGGGPAIVTAGRPTAVCEGTAGGAGIMTGAASGPPL